MITKIKFPVIYLTMNKNQQYLNQPNDFQKSLDKEVSNGSQYSDATNQKIIDKQKTEKQINGNNDKQTNGNNEKQNNENKSQYNFLKKSTFFLQNSVSKNKKFKQQQEQEQNIIKENAQLVTNEEEENQKEEPGNHNYLAIFGVGGLAILTFGSLFAINNQSKKQEIIYIKPLKEEHFKIFSKEVGNDKNNENFEEIENFTKTDGTEIDLKNLKNIEEIEEKFGKINNRTEIRLDDNNLNVDTITSNNNSENFNQEEMPFEGDFMVFPQILIFPFEEKSNNENNTNNNENNKN